ncbi:Uncharacterised protein [Mycobacteroides abscessus]|nr:Uncharacterised protein [Mycobacteroides abscessus]
MTADSGVARRVSTDCVSGSSTRPSGAHGSGLYAPMPPVFGPASASNARLKSWAGASGTTVAPSLTQKRETSGPSRYSSTTTHGSSGVPSAARRGVAKHAAACSSAA